MDLNYYKYFSIGVFGTGFSIFLFRWIRSFKSRKCKCVIKQRKTVIITGATSGLGKACAYELSKRNCKLILGCRNVNLGQKIAENITKSQSIARVLPLDLSDLDSIKNFCETLSDEKIDVLINNAGVMTGHFRMVQCTKTEEDMTVNYLGPFLLTNLLLPKLGTGNLSSSKNGDNKAQGQSSDPARIIFISSSLCKKGLLDISNLDFSKHPYSPMQAYTNSKLTLCLFSRELHKQLRSTTTENDLINVITMFTGGMVNTALSRNIISSYNILFQPILRFIMWLFLKDPKDACHSIVHCAISEELKTSSDELFSNFKAISWPDRVTESMILSKDLWKKSCEIVGIQTPIIH